MDFFGDIKKATSLLVGLGKGKDEKSVEEFFDYEKAKNKHDIYARKSFEKHRIVYGFLTFVLVAGWLCIMLYFVLAQGLGRLPTKESKFNLSEPVIIAIITTTTVNVLALLIIVLRNLFPSTKEING